MKILVVNAGSSSLKYQLMDMTDESVKAKGVVERIGQSGSFLKHSVPGRDTVEITLDAKTHVVAIKAVLDALVDKKIGILSSIDEIDAVGHRVLHGGEKFAKSVVIDQECLDAIEEFIPLGPLHNPANLMGIKACEEAMPNVPMVAVFDTAFHQTMPKEAFMYGLPYEAYRKHRIRRYGFHGTSHLYVSGKAAEVVGKDIKDLKIITCHIGNGSSLAAVKYGKCVDTSMGLTPLEGLVMGTRCGDIDPAIVPIIMEREGLTPAEMDTYMNKKSGVLGLSDNLSSDFRDLGKAFKEGNEYAELALKVVAYRIKKYIGSYAAVMNGVDIIVFTAGVGENDSYIREITLEGLEYLGVELDKNVNDMTHGKIAKISTDNSKVAVYVIPTNEELVIARDTQRLVNAK